jgi:hypothetical protein
MKRILLIVTMLMLVTPALAGVTITATNEANSVVGNVRISYTADANVRAFAFDVNVDANATITRIYDYNVGDTNGYGVFPGTFRDFVNASSPNWIDPCYTPVAPSGDPGAQAGLGTGAITVELGSLGVALGSIRSGTLFMLDVNTGGNPTCNLTMLPNSVRGGIVDDNGNAYVKDVNLTLAGCEVTTPRPCIDIPVIVGGTMTDANNAITGIGLVVGNITYDCCDNVAADLVMSQDTGCVPAGTPVNYVVSTGDCCIDIPAILDHTMTDANSDIRTAGLTGTIAITYECNCIYAANHVIRQDTGCVAVDATINYVVNTCVNEPNVVGLCSMIDANNNITGVGLAVGTITYQYSTTVAAGCIISQSPTYPNCVQLGSAVSYVVSKGMQPPAWIVYGPKDWDLNIIVVWDPCIAGTTGYRLERSANGGSTWAEVYSGAKPTTKVAYRRDPVSAGSYRYKVRAYNALGNGTDYTALNRDCNAKWEVNCFPANDVNYAAWKTAGRPRPWCYKRQCHGDADGKYDGTPGKTAVQWVVAGDLTLLKSAWMVYEPPDGNGIDSLADANAVGSDFNRKFDGGTQGKTPVYRIGTTDLGVLKNYWQVKESPYGPPPGVPTIPCAGGL